MRRALLCMLVAMSAVVLSACCDDCGCRRHRHHEGSRGHNQLKTSEAWAR